MPMPEQSASADVDFTIHEASSPEECPAWTDWDSLAVFLHENLKPYEDSVADIRRGIDDAFVARGGRSGFVLIAGAEQEPAGALVMLRTGMQGYVPENLLLFVAVACAHRGCGLGARLISRAIEMAAGDVKLHVEYDNPARRLYERLGFQSKYAEMRCSR